MGKVEIWCPACNKRSWVSDDPYADVWIDLAEEMRKEHAEERQHYEARIANLEANVRVLQELKDLSTIEALPE